MALHFFFAIFPVLLLLLVLLARPSTAHLTGATITLTSSSSGYVSAYDADYTAAKRESRPRHWRHSGSRVCGLGALNGTWAMMTGLNKAYEIEEKLRWWRLLFIMVGLTVSLSILGSIALALSSVAIELERSPAGILERLRTSSFSGAS
jgi:uncharacterized BrkB/YihY/UPF0761 family membrane protein